MICVKWIGIGYTLYSRFDIDSSHYHFYTCDDFWSLKMEHLPTRRKMTKKEIVKTISEEIGLTQLKTKEIVQRTFDAIVETLVTDGRIELRNFGVFEVKKRAARKARNPRTGDKVDVPEKFVVTFKPGKEMEARVRQMEIDAQRESEPQAGSTQGLGGGEVQGTPDVSISPESLDPFRAHDSTSQA